MAKAEKFPKHFFIKIDSAIYKTVWTPSTGEKLFCQHDELEEAKQFDIYAVGVYKKQGQEKVLVGHVPIEFSFLFYKFIERDGNKIYAKARGGRQLENGLVVPCYIHCMWKE